MSQHRNGGDFHTSVQQTCSLIQQSVSRTTGHLPPPASSVTQAAVQSPFPPVTPVRGFPPLMRTRAPRHTSPPS